MHGSIKKLIRAFGNEKLLNEYISVIHSIKDSELYKLHFNEFDNTIIEKEALKLPSSFKFFEKDKRNNYTALKYLQNRGIGWDIIEKYKLGYTEREEENKKGSFRVIIPSYNALGELNYWVGRDYLPKSEKYAQRIKYDNPKVEKKDIIFNEDKIQWDADITLVEGTFDHIVVPNSIPLLGKALNKDYKLYWELINRANGNINVWLDGDAYESVKQIYSLLNHGNLYNKIRYIPTNENDDPSSLYQKGGYKEIARHLTNAQQIKEIYL
jgi:DNA primase